MMGKAKKGFQVPVPLNTAKLAKGTGNQVEQCNSLNATASKSAKPLERKCNKKTNSLTDEDYEGIFSAVIARCMSEPYSSTADDVHPHGIEETAIIPDPNEAHIPRGGLDSSCSCSVNASDLPETHTHEFSIPAPVPKSYESKKSSKKQILQRKGLKPFALPQRKNGDSSKIKENSTQTGVKQTNEGSGRNMDKSRNKKLHNVAPKTVSENEMLPDSQSHMKDTWTSPAAPNGENLEFRSTGEKTHQVKQQRKNDSLRENMVEYCSKENIHKVLQKKKLPKKQSEKARNHNIFKRLRHSQLSQGSEHSCSQGSLVRQASLSQFSELALSQPPTQLSPRERLEWLQKRRDIGLWVQCSRPLCSKWRYLADVKDPVDVPFEWFCSMNSDPQHNSCAAPEHGPTLIEEEDLIHNVYTAGSVVWGHLAGYPWWPALVDDDPDVEQYYWLNGFSDIPTHYNVVFFDDKQVSRAWLTPGCMEPFRGNESGKQYNIVEYKGMNYEKRLEFAKKQAVEALGMEIGDRLKKFSFIARYKGPIGMRKRKKKNPHSSETLDNGEEEEEEYLHPLSQQDSNEDEIYNSYEGLKKKQEKSENKRVTITKRKLSSMSGTEKKQKREGLMKESISNDGKRKARIKITPRFQNHSTGKIVPKFSKSAKNVPRDKQTIKNKVLQRNEEEDMEDEEIVLSQDIFGDDEINNKEHYSEETEDFTNMATIGTGDILNTESKDTCSNSITSNSNTKRKAQEKKIHKANAADVGLTTENICDQPSQGKSGSKDMNLTPDSNTTVQNNYKDADNVILTLTSQRSTTSQRIAKHNTESTLFGNNRTQNSKNSASNITTGDILNTERKDTCSNSVTSNSNIKRKAQEKKIHKANAADVGLTTENVCDQPSQGKSGSKDMNLTSDSNTTVQNGYKDADNVISTLTSQGSTTSQRIAKNNTESKLFGKNITQNSKNSASNITTLEMQTCNEYDNHKDEKVEPPSTSSRQSTQQNCAIASMSGSSRINSPCPASIFNRTTPRRVPGETQDDNTDAVVPQIELNLNDVENTCEADLSSDDFEAEE